MQIQVTKNELGTYVNPETGEVYEQLESKTITTTRKVQNYNEFIMVYLEDMSSFLRLDNATQIKLLSLIWRDIAYAHPGDSDGNTITIVKAHKDKWAKEIEVEPTTIANALTALVKKELLTSTERSVYKLNAKYFFKGKSSDRKKILEKVFRYEIGPDKSFTDEE